MKLLAALHELHLEEASLQYQFQEQKTFAHLAPVVRS
jgi:hypothetical protein